MAGLADLHPAPLYRVVGETHPKVLERDGDAYRERLQALVLELGISPLVEFDGRYLDGPTLRAVVRGADVILLPYDSREQVTSGVLTEAVAAGKPVVSTRFPHAVELLSSGAGLLVPQRDPAATAGRAAPGADRTTTGGLDGRHCPRPLRRTALARDRGTLRRPRAVADRAPFALRRLMRVRPVFDHLDRLSTSTGLHEHALLTSPRPEHGFCLDDVARGLVVTVREPDPTPTVRRLRAVYLDFVVAAQTADGGFHNRRDCRRELDRRGRFRRSLGPGPVGARMRELVSGCLGSHGGAGCRHGRPVGSLARSAVDGLRRHRCRRSAARLPRALRRTPAARGRCGAICTGRAPTPAGPGRSLD